MELGKSKLNVTVDGRTLGYCDVMTTLAQPEPPRALMQLSDDGSAKYLAEAAALSEAWSDRCVTDKSSALGCESGDWTGVTGCHLECETCVCSNVTGTPKAQDGIWSVADGKISLSLFGKAVAFDFCLSGRDLKLSADDVYLEFRQVFPVSTPTPCSERDAQSCDAGGRCYLDGDACKGMGQASCEFQEYGIVPGCRLELQPMEPVEPVEPVKPMVCRGTPPSCSDVDVDDCDALGCTLNTNGTCRGGNLECSSLSTCPEGCDDGGNGGAGTSGGCPEGCDDGGNGGAGTSDGCTGTIACSVLGKADCETVSANPASPCFWEASSTCTGTARACEILLFYEQCEATPGCMLVEATP
jgi:hypothetical protein